MFPVIASAVVTLCVCVFSERWFVGGFIGLNGFLNTDEFPFFCPQAFTDKALDYGEWQLCVCVCVRKCVWFVSIVLHVPVCQ